MNTFTTMQEAIEYVETALQDFQRDYDTEAIAREMTEWEDGKLIMVADSNEFWQIVMSNER